MSKEFLQNKGIQAVNGGFDTKNKCALGYLNLIRNRALMKAQNQVNILLTLDDLS